MPGTEIATAYVQIIPTTKGIKGSLEKELGGAADDAASSAGKSSGSIFGKIFGGAAKIGIAALGTMATATAGIGSAAVKAYADYEQLVGGVETLFGDSADAVSKYASEAYKTAGLSANQYMEQSTSFAASLLQGLGGDQAKAAEYANTAIIDMSDNANKMGSSMEAIQNAYQGFAKGNYTMLDNLNTMGALAA